MSEIERGEFRAIVNGDPDVDLGVFATEAEAVAAIGEAVGTVTECKNGYHVVPLGTPYGGDSVGHIIDEVWVRRKRAERIAELRVLIPELQAELARLEDKT